MAMIVRCRRPYTMPPAYRHRSPSRWDQRWEPTDEP